MVPRVWPGPLTPELGVGETPELLVDQGKEPIHGLGVAAAHLEEEVGDLPGVAGHGRRGLIHGRGILTSCGACWRTQCPDQDAGRGTNWQHRTPAERR